jgi:hypothetical protein
MHVRFWHDAEVPPELRLRPSDNKVVALNILPPLRHAPAKRRVAARSWRRRQDASCAREAALRNWQSLPALAGAGGRLGAAPRRASGGANNR